MTNDEFLAFVRSYVAANPDVAAHVANHAQTGLNAALSKAYERAADMELALVAATSKKFKGADQVILDKLEKWKGQTSCRWDWLTSDRAAKQKGK
jgi:hypothetical protein